LARLCKIGLLTVLAVKKFEFPKSKMAEAAILKTVKSPYLSNRLTDSDEIWHADADWGLADRGRVIEIFNFSKKTRWRRSLFSKTQIAISQQGIDRSSRNLASLCKICLLSAQIVKKIEFQKSEMADGRHCENR